MLATSAMHNIFVTYYLDYFLYRVRLTPFWFFFGQSVFLVWNASNDVIFGWLSDTSCFGLSGGDSNKRNRCGQCGSGHGAGF
jgi:hypothetical protein